MSPTSDLNLLVKLRKLQQASANQCTPGLQPGGKSWTSPFLRGCQGRSPKTGHFLVLPGYLATTGEAPGSASLKLCRRPARGAGRAQAPCRAASRGIALNSSAALSPPAATHVVQTKTLSCSPSYRQPDRLLPGVYRTHAEAHSCHRF